MNTKKYLREQAEQDKQKVLSADNGDFIRSLQNNVEVKTSKQMYMNAWLVSTFCLFICVIVLVSILLFYKPADTSPIIYLEQNFDSYESTIEELNNDMQNFTIEIDITKYTFTVVKTIDSISNDTIYYTTNIHSIDLLINFEIVSVCNKYYKYTGFNKTDEFDNLQLTNYTIAYLTNTTINPDFGVNMLSGLAEIHLGDEYVYITNYSEMILDTEDSFLKIIQEVIK